MKPNTKTDEFDYLRSFVADPASGISETAQIRSEARLEQILASPPYPEPTPSVRKRLGFSPSRSRVVRPATPTGKLPQYGKRPLLRWIAIPVSAAAIIVAGIIWPHNSVTPAPALTAHAALATWQPAPTELAPDLLDIADTQCRNNLTEQARTFSPHTIFAEDDLLISERRGDWGLLSYLRWETIGGQQLLDTGDCLVWFPANAPGSAIVMTSVFDAEFRGRSVNMNDDGGPARPDTISAWVGPIEYRTVAGAELPNLRQIGAYFEDGTAFQAVVGLSGPAEVVIQAGDNAIIPAISGNWFSAWWPVTADISLQTETYQCWDNLMELVRLGVDTTNVGGCSGAGGMGFSPQPETITITRAGGDTSAFYPMDQVNRQIIADMLEAAREAARIGG